MNNVIEIMMRPDTINGLFELFAVFFVLNHCRVLYSHKEVRGVSIASTGFFALWGFWNMFYYPHLGQVFSYYCGILVCFANMTWVYMMGYYMMQERKRVLQNDLDRIVSRIKEAADNVLENTLMSEYYDHVLKISRNREESSKWVYGPVARRLKQDGLTIEQTPVSATQLGSLILHLDLKNVSRYDACIIFEKLWHGTATDVEALITELN